MRRRLFLGHLGALFLAPVARRAVEPLRSAPPARRRLRRVGIQLYTLRDAAKLNLERTLADIAAAGYNDVEMLGSMGNFGASPARVREMLDRNGLRAPSTHVHSDILDRLDRELDDARTMGHEYLIIASLPGERSKTLDDYRYWADRINEAGVRARRAGVWLGFHNHAGDFTAIDGKAPYDVFVERTDANVVRLQLDTGNLAMTGRDPLDYLQRFGDRYWQFHIKDVPSLGATHDTELGKGVIDFRRLLARIDRIDEKHLYVEQETYPGTPLDSAGRDYRYLASLDF